MKQDRSRAPRLGRQMTLVFASALRTGVVLAGIVTLSSAVYAQFRASITGTVTDTSGAVIPGATLTLTDNGTNAKQVRTSDQNGFYSFNALPPDHFTLDVTKDGFQDRQYLDLQLNAEQANSINVLLTVGTKAETVTVNGSTAAALDRKLRISDSPFQSVKYSTCRSINAM